MLLKNALRDETSNLGDLIYGAGGCSDVVEDQQIFTEHLLRDSLIQHSDSERERRKGFVAPFAYRHDGVVWHDHVDGADRQTVAPGQQTAQRVQEKFFPSVELTFALFRVPTFELIESALVDAVIRKELSGSGLSGLAPQRGS
jgi:hypothetical protein